MSTQPDLIPALQASVELTTKKPEQPLAMTPIDLLRIALTQGADLEKLTKLMDLQERFEKNEARKAFVSAMNKFKANPPTITKNKHVEFNTTKYRHATLDHVCDEVTEALSAVGITHAWKMKQDGGVIIVICVLTHELGHSEETQLMGNPDISGGKNAIQAIGSTTTYLQRYTLMAACGLAASEDSDANESGHPIVTAAEIEKVCGEMSRAKDLAELKFLFGVAYNKASELGDRQAMGHYVTAKDKRKKELDHAGH
jgi:hypothetical protein